LLPIKAYNSKEIKNIRKEIGASQAIFAAYLNTTASTIQQWEQGKKKPNGLSLKLLNLVEQKGIEILL
jgi:putative transcriptional regulator